MTTDNPVNKFLDLEEQTTSVLEELEKLQQETRHYSAAGEELDKAMNQFSAVSERLVGLIKGIHDVVETLTTIGTPELLAGQKKVHEEVNNLASEVQTMRGDILTHLKNIAAYERRGFFAKLFGSGPVIE